MCPPPLTYRSSAAPDHKTNAFFMILRGCFMSKIVSNLSFWCVEKLLAKSEPMFTLACE